MANSFATAAVMARMANKSREALEAASSGIMLSVISMIIRNVGLASILAFAIFWVIWIPAVAMIALTVAVAYYLLRTSESHDDIDVDIDSPFSFKSAAKFSAIYVAITVVAVVSQEVLGDVGLLATAYTGGLISSAAVAVSAATVYNWRSERRSGRWMVLLGIMASLSSKIVLVEILNGQMRKKAMLPMGSSESSGWSSTSRCNPRPSPVTNRSWSRLEALESSRSGVRQFDAPRPVVRAPRHRHSIPYRSARQRTADRSNAQILALEFVAPVYFVGALPFLTREKRMLLRTTGRPYRRPRDPTGRPARGPR